MTTAMKGESVQTDKDYKSFIDFPDDNSDDEVVGYVRERVDKGPVESTYKITMYDNMEVKITVPSILHYSEGDEVLGKHIYNTKCINCGNDKLFDGGEKRMVLSNRVW